MRRIPCWSLAWIWLLVGPVTADRVQQVEVAIVARQSDAQVAQAMAERARSLAQSSGLTLPVRLYDFDAVQQHCVTDLHITAAELPCIDVIELGPDGNERQVLFHIDNATDVEKSCQAAIRTARGLLGGAGGAVLPEDPQKQQQQVAFYARLLATPAVLGFHPDASVVTRTMDCLHLHFVDPISDPQMQAGMVHQVRALLKAAGRSTDALDHMPLDADLVNHIEATYHDQVQPDILTWALIQGVLEPLDDPHTSLLTPDQTRRLNNTLEETTFAGIGIHIETSRSDHAVVILDVMDDTPAAGAGLRPGDVIVKVNGLSTVGMTPEQISSLLRGAVGSSLTADVRRHDSVRTVTMTRALIKPRSVSSQILNGNVGYLRLHTFAANSATEVEGVLLQWKMARVRGVILDLRNNGGGYVKTAQELCSLFLPKGDTVLSIVGRGGQRQDIASNGPANYAGTPLVVLVNGYSASASELTAGCLRDHHVATLVGVRTFGKGSMQAPFDYPDGTELKVTVAHFYSPSGTIIDRLGVAPDVVVDMDPSLIGQPGDTQLQKAQDLLNQRP